MTCWPFPMPGDSFYFTYINSKSLNLNQVLKSIKLIYKT